MNKIAKNQSAPTARERQQAIRELNAWRRPVTEEEIAVTVDRNRYERELVERSYLSWGAADKASTVERHDSWCDCLSCTEGIGQPTQYSIGG